MLHASGSAVAYQGSTPFSVAFHLVPQPHHRPRPAGCPQKSSSRVNDSPPETFYIISYIHEIYTIGMLLLSIQSHKL